jgi:hypothetical protein
VSEKKLVRWCEISTKCEQDRFKTLSENLNAAGVANSVDFIEIGVAEFQETLTRCKSEYDQIRIGAPLQLLLADLFDNWPADLNRSKVADALVKETGSGSLSQKWWPRCFLVDGLNYTFAKNPQALDLEGGVFILGATAAAFAVVASLARIGFRKFLLADSDDSKVEDFVVKLRAAHFSAQFQAVRRHMITQLPGVNAVAVNTLNAKEESEIFDELVYFNFLIPSGVWLDLALSDRHEQVDAEARNAGAVIRTPAEVAAATDVSWAFECFNKTLVFQDLNKLYEGLYNIKST